ncbi:MAG: hypothetical protein IPK26_15420 [Planctomycetes bacterium]|nr:hypothetical protein [Planctomycetota bacterium]
MRAAPWILFVAASAAAGWLTIQSRDLAQVAGEQEIAARTAAESAAAARRDGERWQRELAAAQQELTGAKQRIAALEQAVQQAMLQAATSAELIAARDRTETALRVARAEEARAIEQPAPEGVRVCLQAIEECLRADGFDGVRFVRARALDAEALRGVELLDVDTERHTSTTWVADRLQLRLDRVTGRLTFAFADGTRLCDGRREPLPPEGLTLDFVPVTGKLWESRLPYLLTASGVYPSDAPIATPGPAPGRLSPNERALWLSRFDRLLEAAGTDPRLRVTGFQGLQDGRFQRARVQGFDGKRLMVLSADCAALAIECDDQAGVVSLLLQDGVLHQKGGESTIPADGHRMLLPKITPANARDTMLGMVVDR